MWFICVVYLRSRVWLFKFQKKQLVKRKIWSNFAWKCGPFLTAKPVYPYSFGNLRWLLIWESLNVRLFLVVSPVFSFTFLWWKKKLETSCKEGLFPLVCRGKAAGWREPRRFIGWPLPMSSTAVSLHVPEKTKPLLFLSPSPDIHVAATATALIANIISALFHAKPKMLKRRNHQYLGLQGAIK